MRTQLTPIRRLVLPFRASTHHLLTLQTARLVRATLRPCRCESHRRGASRHHRARRISRRRGERRTRRARRRSRLWHTARSILAARESLFSFLFSGALRCAPRRLWGVAWSLVIYRGSCPTALWPTFRREPSFIFMFIVVSPLRLDVHLRYGLYPPWRQFSTGPFRSLCLIFLFGFRNLHDLIPSCGPRVICTYRAPLGSGIWTAARRVSSRVRIYIVGAGLWPVRRSLGAFDFFRGLGVVV